MIKEEGTMCAFKSLQKHVFWLFGLILLALVIAGCGIDKDKEAIYDDDKRIAQEGDSYSFFQRSGEEEKKGNHLKLQYSRFYGVQTLWAYESPKECEINLNYDSQVDKGKFKVVLVTPKQEVIKIAEQDDKGSFKAVVPKGKYSVKIVGNNAKGEILLERLSP
jgi:hypothetical protein